MESSGFRVVRLSAALFTGIFVGFLGMVISGEAMAAKLVAKMGTVVNESHPNTVALVRFGQLIKERTNGQVEVKVFPNSQLGGEKEMAEGMRLGSVQGGPINVSVLGSWVPEGQLFNLPFVFRNDDHAYRVYMGPIGKKLAEKYVPHGFRVLGYWVNGVRHPMGKFPILVPSDVKGKKMRVIQSNLHIDVWKLVGANPTPIAWPEVFNSVQTGVVDFLDNSKSTYWSAKLYEVAPHITHLGHIYSLGAFTLAENFWQKLTPAQQEVFRKSAEEVIPFQNHLLSYNDEMALAKAVAAGATASVADKKPWAEAMLPIWEQWAPKVGGMEMIQAVVNTK